MTATAASAGLVDRLTRAWTAPRASARAEIAMADEARLAFYAVAGSALFALGRVGAQWIAPEGAAAADFAGWATAQLAAGLTLRPLSLYLAAGLIGAACRGLGGTGGWRATRAAVFWTGLAAAPAAAVLAVLGAALARAGGGWAIGYAGQEIGAVIWGLLLAPALAEAHGFRVWRVLVGLIAAAGLAALAALLLAGLAAGGAP
ncbi:MAG: hypothetical protein EA355_07475 [Rhodobacteraceae bacterium]|nr:MAG: hypothetical protein EA355_07475 [Paracoccaceae bacterium]